VKVPSAHFEQVWKMFGDVVTLRNLTMEVNDGEMLVLVGASGCGKTTSLRILAGLELPSYGRVTIGDRDVTTLPPGQRDVAMVFQGYALYPHMSVRKNLTFGPRMRGEPKGEIKSRVVEVAEILGLTELLERNPGQLSGGQRQRVALGRALLREPSLFLLDEPLSNLDAALRTQMRIELIRLHRRVGTTTVFVTHDQVEALTMGDRLAVMRDGDLVQIGPPEEVYDNPVDTFVAGFIGSPKMNMTNGSLLREDRDSLSMKWFDQDVTVAGTVDTGLETGLALTVGIRPQDVHWAVEAPSRCTFGLVGRVDVVEPMGSETFVVLDVAGTSMTARLPKIARLEVGSELNLRLDPADLHVFGCATGRRVLRRSAGSANPSLSDRIEGQLATK
jgi:multiple sugar transport system ATP-binding protein